MIVSSNGGFFSTLIRNHVSIRLDLSCLCVPLVAVPVPQSSVHF